MVNFSEHVYSLKYLKLDCLSNMLYKISCIFNCYRLIGVFVIQNYFRKTHIFRWAGGGANVPTWKIESLYPYKVTCKKLKSVYFLRNFNTFGLDQWFSTFFTPFPPSWILSMPVAPLNFSPNSPAGVSRPFHTRLFSAEILMKSVAIQPLLCNATFSRKF